MCQSVFTLQDIAEQLLDETNLPLIKSRVLVLLDEVFFVFQMQPLNHQSFVVDLSINISFPSLSHYNIYIFLC